MIVPDFTPLTGPHPARLYQGLMMSMMDQDRTYDSFIGRSPPHHSRTPPHHSRTSPHHSRTSPHISRSPPHLICSPSSILEETDSIRRSDYRNCQSLKFHVPSMSPAVNTAPNSDSVVSPVSSEAASGVSHSSEVSQVLVSSEDGDRMSTDSCQKDELGDKKAFKCPQCLYFTDRKNNLKRHIVTMHQECSKTLECCGVMFHSKAALRDHVGLFHRGGYRCQICSRNFCRKALLRRHLTVHSGRKDFSCHMCGYATSHKSNLERHQKVHDRRPVCASIRENTDIQSPLPLLDKTAATRYCPKTSHHREKTLTRFILLPNRLKYTHSHSRDTDYYENKRCPSVSSLNLQDVENSIHFDETEDNTIFHTNGSNDIDVSTSYHPPSSRKPSHLALEKPSGVSKFSILKPSRSKPSLLSSKRRIFVTPYKCSECGQSFSKQGDLHGHKCRTLRKSHDIGLSVITAVRKGKIKLLPQRDPSYKNQIGSPECAADADPSHSVIQIDDP